MKAEEVISTIAKFFNDLVGAWVPGVVLAMGLVLMHLGPDKIQVVLKFGETGGAALTMAGLLYALGHTLLAIHEQCVKSLLTKLRIVKAFKAEQAMQKQSYLWFANLVKAQQSMENVQDWTYNDLRSIALSVSTEAESLGRRFMFISLLCNGVATALIIIAIDYLFCVFLSPKFLYAYDFAAPCYIQLSLLVFAAWGLFKQGEAFNSRAMSTPFSVAVAELKFKKGNNDSKLSN